MSNFDSMNDPLSLARKMWGNMGVSIPSLPNMITPTFDVEEIEKKIKDLKAVESWLKMNLSMLQMTIQGLEMQCVTLNAVRAMGQMASSYTVPGSGTTESAVSTSTDSNATSGGDALKQAALWPLTLMQQMQEHLQKAATEKSPATPSDETPKP
ncbi:MAG TPA: hypothetical protein PLS67_13390 [Accumulibacter sp.]|jgi:hypothetical protein|nr:hypothetical protein [Accumulibacter sp.]HQC81487.1 hypothetical protein [Accumulibacter sp.]